ncbi:class I SAM-dependent methyltransferase [Streptomyces sodiiphilus]|uniref:Class I SAM-dependent methyltransferase n=1 Tax=Streptomyces sodiiphilus TaxID=226217 RepID=A0ABN2P2N9_9ACTN
MAEMGTDAYRNVSGLPEAVVRAVETAVRHGFAHSCRPEQGRLLRTLAGGAGERIGETGTGCGVGLAWLASGAPPGARLVSVERDPELARLSAALFENDERVKVVCGDWREITAHGPFGLLVLDGGGQGKTDEPADVEQLLEPGGTVVIDDFTPCGSWPPLHRGRPDRARMHWLDHPGLRAVELRPARDLSTVVGTRRLPADHPRPTPGPGRRAASR